MTDNGNPRGAVQSAVILCPFLLYPAIDFVFRIGNGILAPILSLEFSLGPAELGLVGSVFFITFGLTQLPLGVALDRWGPRRVVATLLVIGIAGGLIFVTTDDLAGLVLGRALLGIGMSGSLMAGIKAVSLWLPDRLPLVTSFLIGMTGLGGMLATGPFAELLRHFTWRGPVLGVIAALCVLLVLLLVLAPAHRLRARPRIAAQFAAYREIFTSMRFWRAAPLTITFVAVASSYLSLWTPLWLRDVAGMDGTVRAWFMFGTLGMVAFGNFAFAGIAQWARHQGINPMAPILIGIGLLLVSMATLLLGPTGLAGPVWILYALLISSAYATYSVVIGNFPPESAARASTALNFLVFVAVFASQWSVGALIEWLAPGAVESYAPAAHRAALAIMLIPQVLALVWYALARAR